MALVKLGPYEKNGGSSSCRRRVVVFSVFQSTTYVVKKPMHRFKLMLAVFPGHTHSKDLVTCSILT